MSYALINRLNKYLSRIPEGLILYFALLGVAWLIFIRAWVSEDAYITFRVIDNFMNGDGLRWNLYERVQVYTHPLWLLLHLPVYYFWDNLFHVTLALSIACSLGAIVWTLFTVERPLVTRLSLFLLPIVLCKSIMDYTSSGLETPLCYLTFAAFGYVVVRLREHKYFWFLCSLTVALSMFNRLDTIVLYAPVLAYLVFGHWKSVNWRQIRYGAMPLVGWLCFSLFYYGFLFPNTKYAKLDTGLPLSLYILQSLNYVKYLFILDTPGFFILCSSLWFVFRAHGIARFIAIGVYAYFLYVLYIGGDYMAGRFWAFPIFATVWLWYVYTPRMRWDVVFAIGCILVSASLVSPMLRDINKNCASCIELKGRILDATRTFRQNTLVVDTYPLKIRYKGQYHFCRAGRKLGNRNPPSEVMFYVGMHAYCAGPQLKAIDMLGLGDPLIARLPASTTRGFYIGHFRRVVPKGYQYAVETGATNRMDPALAKYYKKLRLITAGELWDRKRLKTIVQFNLGDYDKWKYEYINANP